MERYNKQFNTLHRDGCEKALRHVFFPLLSFHFSDARRSPPPLVRLFSLAHQRSEARKKNGGKKKNTFYILYFAQVEISTAIARPLRSLRRRAAEQREHVRRCI